MSSFDFWSLAFGDAVKIALLLAFVSAVAHFTRQALALPWWAQAGACGFTLIAVLIFPYGSAWLGDLLRSSPSFPFDATEPSHDQLWSLVIERFFSGSAGLIAGYLAAKKLGG